MTAADLSWASDHAPVLDPHIPPEDEVSTPPVSVEDRAEQLFMSVSRKFAGVLDPVGRYQNYLHWRAVLEQAAQQLTVRAGVELIELQESGLSSRKIAALLLHAGCPLSPSGVDQAIKRARGAS